MLKDKLYNYFVRKNGRVWYEYERYVREHMEEHKKHRLKHIGVLVKLNWFYRVCKKNVPYLYPDVPMAPPKKNNSMKKSKNKTVLPYVGIESMLGKRGQNVWWVLQLRKYEVVSFDIFDTLILRPFRDPKDLFIIVGKRLNIPRFHQIRIDSEKKVREKKYSEFGTYDVTIYDIYNEVSILTGISVSEGVRVELETEIDYCFANPFMKSVYDMLLEQDVKIILVSDMYYPKDLMIKLLDGCGYTKFEDIFISCEYGVSKASGKLYDIVKEKYDNETIVHVGDNLNSDVSVAKKKGLRTKYYKNCHEIGNVYRADGMSVLIGSLYGGIVNTHLHNGLNTYNQYYEYGYVYGGIYIYGFCKWIHDMSLIQQVDKIIFLARDGDIYKKVFDKYYSDVKTEYLLWSRMSNIKYAVKKQRAEFVKRQFSNKVNICPHIKVYEAFHSIGVHNALQYAKKSGLDIGEYLTQESVESIVRFCDDYWDLIVEELSEGKYEQIQVLENVVNDTNRVAIVDVGWLGSGPLGVKEIIHEDINSEIDVKIYMAASVHTDMTYNIADIYNKDVETYIFSPAYNRFHYGVHKRKNRGMDNALFEMFTQAEQPSYRGFDSEGKMQFDFPGVENYQMIEDIQNGILDFCDDYHSISSHDKYIRNIFGYEVYCPFRVAARNMNYFYYLFSDFRYSFETGNDMRNSQTPPTLGEELKRRGLVK